MMKYIVKTGAKIQGLTKPVNSPKLEQFSYTLSGVMEFEHDQLERTFEEDGNTFYVFHNPNIGGTDYYINLNDIEILL